MKFVQENLLLIVAAFVSGAMLIWPLVARKSAGATVNHVGATRLINDHNAYVIDVRNGTEFGSGHLANSKHMPLEEVLKRKDELKKDKPIIVVCEMGARATKAAGQLRADGFSQVFVLDGGLKAWREAGLPLVKS